MPRKATRDTHIFNYTLPELSEEFWVGLECIIDLSLPDKYKNKIKEIIYIYVENNLSLKEGAIRKEFFSRPKKDKKSDLTKFRESLKNFLDCWEKINKNENLQRMVSDFDAETKVKSKGQLDFFKTITNLEILSFSFELHMQKIQENIRPILKPTSKKVDKGIISPEIIYIKQLADIFEKLGIRISKTISTETTKTPALFLRIIKHLDTALGTDMALGSHSDQALEKLIQRSLNA